MALRNLEQHYQEFLRDSQDSQMFGAEDRLQVESNYKRANQHFHSMASSAEQGLDILAFTHIHFQSKVLDKCIQTTILF